MLFEFQTQVARLTGMRCRQRLDVRRLDRVREAAVMAARVTKRKKVILSAGCTRTMPSVAHAPCAKRTGHADSCSCRPSTTKMRLIARIDDETSLRDRAVSRRVGHGSPICPRIGRRARARARCWCRGHGAVSLGRGDPPGEMGADIACGRRPVDRRRLGFGGPYVGLFACKEKFVRQMPGRLCGETVDADGKRGFVLTLSTREQHIRREKATSNICTNSGPLRAGLQYSHDIAGRKGLRSWRR
jgi:glycine dehydrogenase subunit 1